MEHQVLHGQPAQFHIMTGDLYLATLSGFHDENEALAWAKQQYPGVAEIAISQVLPTVS